MTTEDGFTLVEITDEDFKKLTGLMFTPQIAKIFLDGLFSEKIKLVAERIEKHYAQLNCEHNEGVTYSPKDDWTCNICERVWR